jgi:hypothetical protein
MNSQQLPIIDSGIRTFRVPTSLVTNGSLRTLSGNALSLFLTISYRCYRTRLPNVQYSFRMLFHELDMRAQDVSDAAAELRKHGLVHYQQDQNIMSFQIQQPDGSKAKSYLRKYGERGESVEPIPTH